MGARPSSKFIGGRGVFTPSNTRQAAMRFDIAEKAIRQLIKNSSTGISKSDYMGGRITPDGLYALLGSTVTPFLRIAEGSTDRWVTPMGTTPGSAVNDIAFNSAGSEFAVAMAASPFLYRYAYPGFAILTTTATPPSSATVGVDYNGAGTKLAVALAAFPFLEIFDVASITKEAISFASMPASGVGQDCAFSPDGTKVAFVGSSGVARNVRVWEYPSGTLLFSDTSATAAYKCAFSPDGSKLVVMSSSRVRVYNTATWAFTDMTYSTADYYTSGPRAVQWLDSRFLFFSSEGGSHIIIDTTTNTIVAGMEHGYSSSVGIGVISPLTQPRKIAGTVEDASGNPVARKVRAYDTASGAFLGETTSDGVTGEFSMLIFSAELCTVYAIGSGGENARVYDPVTPAAWP